MKTLLAIAALSLTAPAFAYEFKSLSPQDVLVIGRALDELPRKETEGLYQRLQRQISEQDAQAKKDADAKRQAEIDAAVKAKTEPTEGAPK